MQETTRVTITVKKSTYEALQELKKHTKLKPHEVLAKLLDKYVEEKQEEIKKLEEVSKSICQI